MSNKNIYFITGGGTGGHIYPAVAVADELLKDDNTQKVFYIGNPNNLEATIVKDKNYEFLPVLSSGMPRTINLKFLKWTKQMLLALFKSIQYIKKYNPDAIFGTGGYVSAPVLMAGILCRKPIIMHDCDANPGLVTRELAPFAKSISIAFEIAKSKLKNKNCFLNGNPIRHEFETLSKEQAKENLGLEKDRLVICIMGGSQGAKSINNATVEILEELTNKCNLQVIFQTGNKNYEEVSKKLDEIYPSWKQDKNLTVKPYFEDMVTVLKSSDIAISRSGSLSISEICASSVAPVFIPYPYAAADHQRKNARYMVDKNAGIYIEDSQVNSKVLLDNILKLINNKEELKKIQQNVQNLAVYDACIKIANQIKKYAN